MSPSSCPCGTDRAYSECCGLFHAGAVPATPEELMRSRYSAFAVRDAAYLLATWHPGTAPASVDLDDTVWTGLAIIDAPAASERRGVVEFEARYRGGVLRERSRFVRQSDRWWYLDGVHG